MQIKTKREEALERLLLIAMNKLANEENPKAVVAYVDKRRREIDKEHEVGSGIIEVSREKANALTKAIKTRINWLRTGHDLHKTWEEEVSLLVEVAKNLK